MHSSTATTGKTGTRNWKKFTQQVSANQYLQSENADISLQPGEEYPTTAHPHMTTSYRQDDATMNQITTLLGTDPSTVPSEHRPTFVHQRAEAQENWTYPYTVENPCGTVEFEH